MSLVFQAGLINAVFRRPNPIKNHTNQKISEEFSLGLVSVLKQTLATLR
ncbi:hypothetical protein [Pseudomonas oleovorans]|jgi:hypothetical protein|nr:hypothetical protein [Pseudomonas oleovorans]MDH2198086.1 hypothetical protein [Pseudomonas oleovorans]